MTLSLIHPTLLRFTAIKLRTGVQSDTQSRSGAE